jgi:hypothetical protein
VVFSGRRDGSDREGSQRSGLSHADLKACMPTLKDLPDDFGGRVLYWTGTDLQLLESWGGLRSLLKRPGQLIFHLVAIPLRDWSEDVHAAAQGDAEEIDLTHLRKLAYLRKTRFVSGRAG